MSELKEIKVGKCYETPSGMLACVIAKEKENFRGVVYTSKAKIYRNLLWNAQGVNLSTHEIGLNLIKQFEI